MSGSEYGSGSDMSGSNSGSTIDSLSVFLPLFSFSFNFEVEDH